MVDSTLICDSGTGYLKIGWAKDDFPTTTFPAMVGRPMLRYEEKINDIEIKVLFSGFSLIFISLIKSVMVGDEAAPLRSYLELSHPVEEGIVNNWDDMSLVWNHGFQKVQTIKPIFLKF